MRRSLFLVACLTVGVLGLGWVTTIQGQQTRPRQRQAPATAESMGRAACNGVGVVKQSSQGQRGAPIFILEEVHTSPAGQIQIAIALVRLHERYGLNHIALEGYLKEEPPIKADWYKSAAHEDRQIMAHVAARLLQEGEISSAEFMLLVYNDINIHPIETAREYDVEMSDDAVRAPLLYLLKMAQRSLRQEHVPKIQQLQKEIEDLPEGEAKLKKNQELLDFILSVDPFTEEHAKALANTDLKTGMTAEKQLSQIEAIQKRAKSLSLSLNPEEEKAMADNLTFWRGRVAASKTMVRSTEAIADRSGGAPIAMSVGAAHTNGVCEMLRVSRRPFVVISPLSLERGETTGDLTYEMLQRKYKKHSVYSEGFKQTLQQVLRTTEKKLMDPVMIRDETLKTLQKLQELRTIEKKECSGRPRRNPGLY